MESILGKVQVWSLQTRVMVRNGYNFLSDRWIAIRILLDFSDAIFNGVEVESILDELQVRSRHAIVTI
jgi:hypothetical protein